MFPIGVNIDARTGALFPNTGEYTKRLSEVRDIYRDQAALDALIAAKGDLIAYTVVEFREPGSDMFFGTTTMQPGTVGDECFMTRGHYHARRDCGEIYYTQSGQGLLLLQSRAGETRHVEMKPSICAHIPPDWAHRSVNTGDTPLVFVWCTSQDAGHDYGEVAARGMRELVLKKNGAVSVEPNPRYAS